MNYYITPYVFSAQQIRAPLAGPQSRVLQNHFTLSSSTWRNFNMLFLKMISPVFKFERDNF